MKEEEKIKAKKHLFRQLKREHAFWSYDPKTVVFANIDDDSLIEHVLYHLDIDDVILLFNIYPHKKIKEVWDERLCPLGDYFKQINRFYAYCFFGIKNPDRYLKVQENRFIQKKCA